MLDETGRSGTLTGLASAALEMEVPPAMNISFIRADAYSISKESTVTYL